MSEDVETGNTLPSTVISIPDIFTQRLAVIMQDLGRDTSVQVTGKSWKQLSRYGAGESEPPFSVALALAKAAGRSLSWLINGQETGVSGFDEEEDARDFTLIPRVGIAASAGHGLVALAEEITERLAFKTDWLREMGLSPKYCGLLTCSGDSQDPVIKDGALMLVDLRPDQHVRSGNFYIVVLDGDVLVKLVNRRVDGTVELISHNPAYPKEVIDSQQLDKLTIPGRVVWAGQKL